jgi:oligosaccharide repeat unit polymerase
VTWLSPFVWLLLAAAALFARRRAGTWYAPAPFFAGFWAVLAGAALLVTPIPVGPGGVVVILLGVLAFSTGAEGAQRLAAPGLRTRSTGASRLPLLEWMIVLCTLLGFVTVVVDLASRGHGPQVFLSLKTLGDTARDFSVARYSNGWQEPIAARVLVAATYLGALLAGVAIATRDSGWTRWATLVVFVPSALLAAILTTKTSLILPIAMGGSSFLATRLAREPRLPHIDLKRALLMACALLAIGGVLILVQMGRYGYTNPDQARVVVSRFSVDLFAFLGVFSTWVEGGGWRSLHPAWGFYDFAGLFDLFHLGHRAPGLYLQQVNVNGEPYNIYTAFRGLIEDFTLPGALIALAMLGFGAETSYSRVRSGDVRYSAPLAAFYTFTLWSFVVSVFIYNTILLAFLTLALYLAVANVDAVRAIGAKLDILWRPNAETARAR